MPTYRIILEPGQKDAPHRRPRSESVPLHSPERPETMTLMAADLAEAVALGTRPQSRIISVEEVEPTIQLDDDQLLKKLSQDKGLDLEDIAENLSDEPLIGTNSTIRRPALTTEGGAGLLFHTSSAATHTMAHTATTPTSTRFSLGLPALYRPLQLPVRTTRRSPSACLTVLYLPRG